MLWDLQFYHWKFSCAGSTKYHFTCLHFIWDITADWRCLWPVVGPLRRACVQTMGALEVCTHDDTLYLYFTGKLGLAGVPLIPILN